MLSLERIAAPIMDEFVVSYPLAHEQLANTLRRYVATGGVPGSAAQIAVGLTLLLTPARALWTVSRLLAPPLAGDLVRRDKARRSASSEAQVSAWLRGTKDPITATTDVLRALRALSLTEREMRSNADERLAALEDRLARQHTDFGPAAREAAEFLPEVPRIRGEIATAVDAMTRLLASYEVVRAAPRAPDDELTRLVAAVSRNVLGSLRGWKRLRFFKYVLTPRFPELGRYSDPFHPLKSGNVQTPDVPRYTRVMSIADVYSAFQGDSELKRFIERLNRLPARAPILTDRLGWRFDFRGRAIPIRSPEDIVAWLHQQEEQEAQSDLRSVPEAIRSDDPWVHEKVVVFSSRMQTYTPLMRILADAADVILLREERKAREHWGRLVGIVP